MTKEELHILLSLSQQIVNSWNDKTLFKIILERIKPIFEFDDISIKIWEGDGIGFQLVSSEPWAEAIGQSTNELLPQTSGQLQGTHYEELKSLEQPTFFDITELIAKYHSSQILTFLLKLDYTDLLVLPLWKNDTVIGVVEFYSREKEKLRRKSIELFLAAADQFSLATLKVLSNYELTKQRSEKKLLLSLAEDIPLITSSQDLLRLINDKIRPMFRRSDVGLFLITADGKYYWDFITTPIDLILIGEYPKLEEVYHLSPYSNSPIEWLVQSTEKEGKPILFDFSQLTHAFSQHQPLLSNGSEYHSGFSANLRLKSKTVGIFYVCSTDAGLFKERELAFFQAIADQLSIALQSVLINELANERQAEKEILLGISEDISRSRTKKQLFETVSQQIRPLFKFHDMGLFVLSDDDEYHQDLAIDAPEVHSSEWNLSLSEISTGKIRHKNTPVEYIIRKVSEAGEAVIFDNEVLYGKFPHYSQFQSSAFRNNTYRDSLATTLKVGDEVIGMFCINSLKKGFFKKEQYSLFQSVADQLAVAVSNILANEEILRSETEKSLQLAITDIFSEEGQWGKKFGRLPALLEPHLPFKILSFSFLMDDMEDDRSYRFENTGSGYRKISDKTFYKQIGAKKESFLASRRALTERPSSWYNKEDLIELERNNSFTRLVRNAYNTNSMLFENIELSKGNRLILMALDSGHHTYKQKHVNLFKKLTNSFSLSIEKLLAYEEIVHHKKEKEELLKLSEKVAAIRNREELLAIISGQLKELFQYDDVAISINSEDAQSHWLMVSDVMNETGIQERFKTHLTTLIPNDAAYQKVIASSSPLIFDYASLKELQLPKEDLEMIHLSGLHHVAGVALRQGGKTLGGIFMLAKTPVFSTRKFSMYKNTADQIATAVSNILNNEEILKRQEEKEVMLRISEQINQARSRKDIVKLMNGELKPLFNFEFTSLIFHKKGEKTFLPWIMNPTQALENHPDFQKIQQAHQSFDNGFLREILNSQNIRSISIEDLIKRYPNYPGVVIYKENDIKSIIVVPLSYAKHSLGLWTFNSKDEHLLEKLNMSLLENTASQLAIAVSSLLANEEIIEREKIKSLQVGIQSAFDGHRRLSDKLKEAVHIFQDIIPFDYISFDINMPNEIERGVGFERLDNKDFRMITPPGFFKMTGLTNQAFQKLKADKEINQPCFFNGYDFEVLCEEDDLIKLYHERFKVNTYMVIPLKLSRQGVFNIAFFTKIATSFTDNHLELFGKVESAFTVGLEKYLSQEEILRLNQQLNQEKQYLAEEININYNFGELVGESEEIKKVFKQIEQVARTGTTVLITGETGTGKEVIARAIHNSSDRKNKPLVKLNCAALPPQLMESELFGHEKGSFTGATGRRIGKFELAHKGTIFLDEIGEMPLELQAKLLRVLQEKEVERVGGNTVIKVDVRIITATNRNLEKEIANNQFRSDLFYRLNVFPIHIPPLRERKADILPLVHHFIKTKSKRIGKNIDGISAESAQQLSNYSWPGNIRELEHVIERGLILSKNNLLKISLGEEVTFGLISQNGENDVSSNDLTPFKTKTISEAEKELIVNTLDYTQGRVRGEGGAAQLLDIKPTTLEARMKKLGIRKNISYRNGIEAN